MRSSLAFIVAALSLNGCSGRAGEPPGPSISAEQACSDYSKALCAKLDQCRVNGTAITYQNAGTCVAEQTTSCLNAQASPGDGNTPSGTEACAVALPTATCDDYLQNNLTMCPQHTGAVATGGGCVYSSQCQTGFCAVTSGVACGTCAPPPAPGDECVDQGCGRDLACTSQKLCEPYVATGSACDKVTQICEPSNVCVIASGATTGTCQPLVTAPGAPCDPKHETGPSCSTNAGVYCSSTSKTCVAVGYVQPGAACGVQSSGAGYNLCTNASACFSATCVAQANPGEACDLSLGPSCFAGSRCITDGISTAGTCTVIDSATCQ